MRIQTWNIQNFVWIAALSTGTALAAVMPTAAAIGQEVETNPPRQANQGRDADQPREADQGREQTGRSDADREAPKSALGVMIGPGGDRGGVLVREVAPGSPAEEAGLRPGDEILLLDGEKIESRQALAKALRSKPVGTEIGLRVLRDGQQMDVKATLAAAEEVYGIRRSGFRGTGEATGSDKSAWLGVAVDESTDPPGAKVEAVYPGGPAARAGLRDGDVITQIGDQPVKSGDDVAAAVKDKEPGSELELTIVRDGAERKLTAKVGSRMLFAEPHGKTFAEEGEPGQDADRPFDRDAMLDSLPEHVIVLEQNRQLCIQNERLEKMLLEVLEDLEALRQEVAALKNGTTAKGDAASKEPSGQPAAAGEAESSPAPAASPEPKTE